MIARSRALVRGWTAFGESAMTAQYETLQGNERVAAAPVVWPTKVETWFGIGVTPTHYDEAATVILDAARQVRRPSSPASRPVHALITSSRDADLAVRVNTFEMITPDGQPVRWALNLLHGANLADRVYGPELMLRVCRGVAAAGIPIYLVRRAAGRHRVLESRGLAVGMFPACGLPGRGDAALFGAYAGGR